MIPKTFLSYAPLSYTRWNFFLESESASNRHNEGDRDDACDGCPLDARLCEGIAEGLYYAWSKEFLEGLQRKTRRRCMEPPLRLALGRSMKRTRPSPYARAGCRHDLVTSPARRVPCSVHPWPSSPMPFLRSCWPARSQRPSLAAAANLRRCGHRLEFGVQPIDHRFGRCRRRADHLAASIPRPAAGVRARQLSIRFNAEH